MVVLSAIFDVLSSIVSAFFQVLGALGRGLWDIRGGGLGGLWPGGRGGHRLAADVFQWTLYFVACGVCAALVFLLACALWVNHRRKKGK
ncbi:MAG: hypothetical protein ACLRWC_06465 [Acutalibacter sp.]